MNIDIYDIVIASLLHDIGKVMQRAEIPEPSKYEDRCPLWEGKPSHFHVKWTESFLEKFKYEKNAKRWQIITNLAASHHKISAFEPKEENWLAQCIRLADRVSAKWDRKPEETKKIMYKKRPLYPVFDTISLCKHKSKFDKQVPFVSMSEFKKNFLKTEIPYGKADEETKKCSEYKTLYEVFEKDYGILMDKWNKGEISKVQFTNALDSLLEQHFWCVPSNTNETHPTNSLYHHSKTTAAVAATLFSTLKEGDKSLLNDSLIEGDEKLFLLLGGDLSGIQSYIFDLNPENSKGASKTLRARSFKVKILSEMVLHYVLKKLNLTKQNILMNAGGKFMVIIPNKQDLKDLLKVLKEEIDECFFKEFQGMLSINIDWSTEIAFKDLGMDKFKDTVERFMENLELAKKRKFSSYLFENNWETENFVSENALYNSTICNICKRHTRLEPENEDKSCNNCFQDIELGKKLPTNHYCVISEVMKEETLLSLFDDKLHFYLLKKAPSKLYKDDYYFVIDEDVYKPYIPLKSTATFLPILEKEDKKKITDPEEELVVKRNLTFSEIAQCSRKYIKKEDKLKGTSFNAVLKGDVDNLGMLFNLGLQDQKGKYSLTKYSTFSAMIDFFFSQYVPALVKKECNKIYIIYTGGDDFALIGPWNKIIDFVIRLQKDFTKFTCNNSDIHFSAGIELMHGKSPIKNAINKADELLDKSKKEDKNAITIFDNTVKWDEFNRLVETANTFQYWLDELKGFSTQFLYRIFNYHEMYKRFNSKDEKIKGKPEDLMYISYINYDVRRNILSKKNSEELIEDLRKIIGELTLKNSPLMENLRIPLSKVLYENR